MSSITTRPWVWVGLVVALVFALFIFVVLFRYRRGTSLAVDLPVERDELKQLVCKLRKLQQRGELTRQELRTLKAATDRYKNSKVGRDPARDISCYYKPDESGSPIGT